MIGSFAGTGIYRVNSMMAAVAPPVKIALITSGGAHNGSFPVLAHVFQDFSLPVAKVIFPIHQHLQGLISLPIGPPPISLVVVKPMSGEGVLPPKAAPPPENPI